MNNTVKSSLHERAVNGHHGVQTHRGHTTGENHCVLFSDADVNIAFGDLLLEVLEPCPGWHGCCDTHKRAVFTAKLDQSLAEDILPRGRRCLPLDCRSGFDIVRPHPVEFFRVLDGGIISFALLGHHMEDNGLIASLGVFQRCNQHGQVMAIDGA